MTSAGSGLRRVADLARSVSGALELGGVLRHVVAAIEALRPRVFVVLRFTDREAGGFRLAASGGAAVDDARSLVPFGAGLTEVVAQTRKPLLVLDAPADPRAQPWSNAEFPVYYGVPIEVGETLLGVLNVAFPAGEPPTDEEQEIIDALAGHAAVALRNARLLAESEARRRSAEAIAEVGHALSQTLDPDAVGKQIAGTIRTLLGTVASALYRLDPASGDLVAVAVDGDNGGTGERGVVLRRGTGVVGLAVRERHPVVTVDLLTDPRIALDPQAHARAERDGYRAVLAVPLTVKQRVIGALAVGDRAGRVFDAEERRLIQTFADQAALALENARLFALESSRRRQLEALAEIGRELAAELNTDALMKIIVERASQLFAANGAIYLVEGDGLRPRAWTQHGTFPDHRPVFGQAMVGRCADQRRGVIVNDYALSSSALPRFVALGVKRAMASPLVVRDRLLGIITMNRIGDGAAPFSPEDLAALDRFATQAGIAVRNATLYEEAQRRRGEAEELARVARTLTSSLDVRSVGERVVDSVLPLFGAQAASLRLLQPDGSLAAVAQTGRSGEPLEPSHVYPSRGGVAGRAVSEGRAVWSSDVLQEPGLALPDDLRQRVQAAGLLAVLAVPLRAKGEVVGALSIADRGGREFRPAEVDLLQAFADQAALALDNARLYEGRETRAARLRALARLNQIISSSLDVDEVLRSIARAAAELIDAPFVAISIADEATRTLVQRAFSDDRLGADRPDTVRRYGEGGTGWVAVHRRPLNVPDVFADDRIQSREWFRAHGLRSCLTLPILFQESLLGVLMLCGREAFRLGADDSDLLDGFVAQAAVALRNARLYGGQQERASRLRTLTRLNQLVSSSLDMRHVLGGIARAAAELMSAPFVSFWLVDPETQTLRVGAVSDEEMWRDYPAGELAFDEAGVLGEVATTGRAVEIPDVASDQRVLAPRWFAAHGLTSYLGLPITFQGSVLAVLNVNGRAPFRGSDADYDLLEIFAAQAAVAIRNARLFEELSVAHERLAKSQDQMVQTERLRALGEMAAGVAHDFNNLLAVILGRTDLLLRRVDDTDTVAALEAVRQAARDGADTVRRIQEFTRTRTTRPFGRVAISPLVGQVVELTRPRWKDEAQSRGVDYRVTVDAVDAPPVAGRPEELREIFTNLLNNALDAMPGGGRCHFRVTATDGEVIVTVEDTGSGMTEEVRRRVFEPFFTTKGPSGNGLGLAVVWGVVTRHGGSIDVASEPGAGSTFTVRLPVASDVVEPAPAPPPAVEPSTAPARILVIDDEPAVRTVLAKMLEDGGHQVAQAADGAEALARCERETFDLVLSDVSMPRLSGWEVAAACRERFPLLPVGLITGWGDQLDPGQLDRHGVRFVVAKPFEQADLLKMVSLVLGVGNGSRGRSGAS